MNDRVVHQQKKRGGERGDGEIPRPVQEDNGYKCKQTNERDGGDAGLVLVFRLLEAEEYHQNGNGRVESDDVHLGITHNVLFYARTQFY
jgi:hypothetical protein